jgi:hypothetical protein
MVRQVACASLVIAGLGVGCVKNRDEPPPTIARTRVTGAEVPASSGEDVVARIATARCDRELGCGKIGTGKRFEDQPSCLAEMGELADEEAGPTTCPFGVNALEETRCLLDIALTACGGELERAPNIASCTKVVLCNR